MTDKSTILGVKRVILRISVCYLPGDGLVEPYGVTPEEIDMRGAVYNVAH